MAEEIRTPDRRVRVFVSSTLAELGTERVAVREAIEALHLIPVLFELGARPHPPRALYRAYLEQSDIFVGVYWERYGWIAPDEEVSGLEDEYSLAAGRMPQLVYIKEPADEREERLGHLLDAIQADDRLAYRRFRDADELRALVADDLAILLSERCAPADSAAEPAPRSTSPPVPLERTLGRDDDVDAVAALVKRGHRFVTLTGPGGIGKTRLAIEASRRLADERGDRVVFVSLAAVVDPSLVLPTIAAELGVRLGGVGDLRDEVAADLRGRPAILLLDNFEHLATDAGVVADLLGRAAGCVAIVTSRHTLRVHGEREFTVAPLATDDAVALFAERAAAARHGFALDDANRPTIEAICDALDGLPLAIELAAACMRLFTPTVLLQQLSQRLELLSRGASDAPERQRTLRRTMDWSYDLLDEHERRLFTRLGVFSGGWTLSGADAVCGRPDEPTVLELLGNLVEKSLVVSVDAGTEPRLRMLETVRTYAVERLSALPDRDETERRHTAWMFELLLGESRSIRPPHHRSWLELFDHERANLRAAVQRAIAAADVPVVVDLVRSSLGYLSLRDAENEALEWLEQASSLRVPLDAAVEGRLLMLRAVLVGALGRYDESAALIAESDAVARPADDFDAAIAAMAAAVVASATQEAGQALEVARRAAEAMAKIGSDVGEAYMLQTAGTVALTCDPDCADDHLNAALHLADAMAHDGLRAQALTLLGFSARRAGDAGRARSLFVEAARAAMASGQRSGMAYALDGLAAAALDAGKAGVAVRALGSSAAVRSSIDRTPWAAFHPLLDEVMAAAHAVLGERRHADALAEGASIGVGDALALTLTEI